MIETAKVVAVGAAENINHFLTDLQPCESVENLHHNSG